MGGAGRRLNYLHSGGADASAPVLAATFATPSVAPTAAPITASTGPSRAPCVAARAHARAAAAVASTAAAACVTSAASVTSATAVTSRAPGTSADGQLAALHSCGGKDSPQGGQRTGQGGPSCTYPRSSPLHPSSLAASDLPKAWIKASPFQKYSS